ncbi:MAG: ATP-binding protein [Flavobacteriaceae bacterium]
MFFRTWFGIVLCFVGLFSGYSQGRTYELDGANDDDLYPYMLYWKDTSEGKNSLNEAVLNLRQGNFKAFDSENGKNLGLFPEPVWLYLNVKNISERHRTYWWAFYTHTDTIIIYEKQNLQWQAADTLVRNKLLGERNIRHRASAYLVSLENGEEQSYLVQLINPRHTQNSFVSLTTPVHHLLWEKGFYWTIGSFIGIFLITGIVSLIIGFVVRERTFFLFFVYLFAVSVLILYEELMVAVIDNETVFSLINSIHPLPLSLIATCLNFYIVDYIFGKADNSKLLRFLTLLNTICLFTGTLSLAVYMLFMTDLHSGQTLFLWAWYGIICCIFISILVTALKIIILSVQYKKLYYGIPFLLLIVFVNPATYILNYSGIFSFYQITYPNYFYWFVSAEFIFIGFLMGWRYKKNLEDRHRLEIEFTQRELTVLNDERKQIARDLHDDLGATINAIKLFVTNSYPDDKPLVETISKASNDIRIFYKKLIQKPSDESVKESIEKLTAAYNGYGQIRFGCIFSGDESLLSDIQKENIYKIVSEIFTNTLKHSKATEATVQLLIDSTSAQLIAEDNGTGFSVEQAQKARGMGVKNIHQRVAVMRGKLHISSGKGNTTYIIEIPVKR